ncbi:MAG: hypothetical protein LBB05_01800, partial [Puniceicoccales bacterium]|nr:hypothetical protein [Puniceicoccales bacterium]
MSINGTGNTGFEALRAAAEELGINDAKDAGSIGDLMNRIKAANPEVVDGGIQIQMDGKPKVIKTPLDSKVASNLENVAQKMLGKVQFQVLFLGARPEQRIKMYTALLKNGELLQKAAGDDKGAKGAQNELKKILNEVKTPTPAPKTPPPPGGTGGAGAPPEPPKALGATGAPPEPPKASGGAGSTGGTGAGSVLGLGAATNTASNPTTIKPWEGQEY